MTTVYIYNKLGDFQSMFALNNNIHKITNIGTAYTNTVKEYYQDFYRMHHLQQISLDNYSSYNNIIILSDL